MLQKKDNQDFQATQWVMYPTKIIKWIKNYKKEVEMDKLKEKYCQTINFLLQELRTWMIADMNNIISILSNQLISKIIDTIKIIKFQSQSFQTLM